MTHSFICTFKTDLDNEISITIPNANPSAGAADIREVMQKIIDDDTIDTAKGKPQTIVRAALISGEICQAS